MPITTLDTGFLNHIVELEATSAAAADATMLTGQRQWMYPPLGAWDGDTSNITGMNDAFDRAALNTQYEDLVSDQTQESTIGEVMITKLQVDYIAALERAFRTRHCSSVRAKLHAAARRRGMGTTAGPFTGSVVLWLTRLLQAAHDDPNP